MSLIQGLRCVAIETAETGLSLIRQGWKPYPLEIETTDFGRERACSARRVVSYSGGLMRCP